MLSVSRRLRSVSSLRSVLLFFCALLISASPSIALGQDATAPNLSNLSVSGIALRSATLNWQSNEPTFCKVWYNPGTGDSYRLSQAFNTTAKTSYSVSLVDLNPKTLYQAKITCRDTSGNYTTEKFSNFTTLQADPTLPFAAEIGLNGPQNVVAEHALHLNVRALHLAGTWSNPRISYLGGLPESASIVFETSGQEVATYYQPGNAIARIQTQAGTPLGEYTISFSLTAGQFSTTAQYVFNVKAMPAPINPVPVGQVPAIPLLDKWNSDMTTYGDRWCSRYEAAGGTGGGIHYHYDPQYVFYQIADHTTDTKWNTCAHYAETIYRDEYLLPNDGRVQAYYTFPDGLLQDYLKTQDSLSKTAVELLGRNSPAVGIVDRYGVYYTSSRPVAFGMKTFLALLELDEEEIAAGRHLRAADIALGHIDQWFVSKTAGHYKPFMVGVTMNALIKYYEKTEDPRVPDAIIKAADGLWDCCWLGDKPDATVSDEGFFYTSSNLPQKASPTPLNAIIAPAYAWLYHHTGNDVYRQRGDRIFAGGVNNASSGNIGFAQKQFSQQYLYSFDYVRWRLNPREADSDTTAPNSPSGLRIRD